MILATHAAVASALTVNFPYVPGIGLLSHYMLDSIPHRDYDIFPLGKVNYLKIAFDGAIGLLLAFWIGYTSHMIGMGILGGLMGVLPDFLQFLHRKGVPYLTLHQTFHNWCHTPLPTSFFIGAGSQLLLLGAIWTSTQL
jgi:hypothetical protein